MFGATVLFMSLNGACLGTAATSPMVLKVSQFDLLERFDNTDMRCLMPGLHSEKCDVRRFHHCVNVYLHKPR
jgi:hypothetical protein